ncbi:MAG TPA: hypothetical protein VKI43_11335 [Vicinamibacterales bacterium]|nr:hypothetical protein [Vicinamibacterales bacterium]
MQLLLPVHIVAGGLAIVLGGVALLAAKGATLHRKSGILFVYAMLTMGISASILALRNGFTNPNFLGGFTSVYFVITALTAVRPATGWSQGLTRGAAALAFGLALFEIGLAVSALGNPHFMINGVPGPMLVFLAMVTLFAGVGDIRVMRSGPLRGAPRLKRHLWRMCFALFIAAGSFFSIRARVAKILPEPFLSAPMRALPVVLVFLTMFYWLWRVRGRAGRARLTPL